MTDSKHRPGGGRRGDILPDASNIPLLFGQQRKASSVVQGVCSLCPQGFIIAPGSWVCPGAERGGGGGGGQGY